MAHHISHEPKRVHPKPREKGAAHAIVHHERRHKTVEGRAGYIGPGATITGATVQTASSPSNYYPGIVYDANGLRAYNSGGVITMSINAADGSVTVNGTGVITGGTIQTSATNPRVVMDGGGIRAYNAIGTQTFGLSGADGSLTVTGTGIITGATIQTSTGPPRVVMDTAGIRAYDATGTQKVNVDATTGLITATGVITSQPGSTVPWQTTGFYVGGGNLLPNASAEDPTTTSQVLYADTGSLSAGTFTLQYGSNPQTSALAYNVGAATVQSALQATGVLPAGALVSCTGGPLPKFPIYIALGGLGMTPSVIAVASQSVTGGSVVVGAVPISWSASIGVLDRIAYSESYHGGYVFRLTNNQPTIAGASTTGTSQLGSAYAQPGLIQPGTLNITAIQGYPAATSGPRGPYGLIHGLAYTYSAYYKSILYTRQAQNSIYFQDINQGNIVSYTVTSSWTTSNDWQRLVLTAPVPPAAQKQKISMSGSVTAGSFTLTLLGQTTTAISWNATLAQVESALQALSNVGSSGVVTAWCSGGPLPSTPIQVVFSTGVGTPSSMMTPMTATSSLTGTSPGVLVEAMKPYYVLAYPSVLSPGSGEVFYVDAQQLEVGDAPTAFAPKPDEILADTVVANMINVAQLSAISADMGSIVAGTITGGTFQTSTNSNVSKVVMDNAGVRAYNASGTNTVNIDTSGNLTAIQGTFSGSITGASGTIGGITFNSGGISSTNFSVDTLGRINASSAQFSGTINSSTISASTITGSTEKIFNGGTQIIQLDGSNGIEILAGTNNYQAVSWATSIGGTVIGKSLAWVNGGTSLAEMQQIALSPSSGTYSQVVCRSDGGNSSTCDVSYEVTDGLGNNSHGFMMTADGRSSFVGAGSGYHSQSSHGNRWWLDGQFTAGVSIAGNSSSVYTIGVNGNPGNGFQVIGSLRNGAWLDHCSWAVAGWTTTPPYSIDIRIGNNQANAASGNFDCFVLFMA